MSKLNAPVSVVIPCFNAAKFLRQTIDSALTQSHPPLEVIVVDDGSTDDSAAIAESYTSPVQVLRQHNQGPSIARNVGTKASSGNYLMYLDADDLLAPDALKLLSAAVVGNSERVAVMGCAVFEDDPSRPTKIRAKPYDAFLPNIIRSNLRNPICWLTPRSHFDRVGGFSDETRPFEDWDFWAQIALTGAELKCIPYVGGLYRRHGESVMRTVKAKKRALGHTRVVERLANGLLENDELLEQWGYEMFWSAWTALHHGRQKGLTWRELRGLREAIRQLVKRGPESVRRSSYSKWVRLLGIPVAESLRNLAMGQGGPISERSPVGS